MNRLSCIVFTVISVAFFSASSSAQVIDCSCASEYSVGDRVVALVDNPSGAVNLPAGTLGTVLCGDTDIWDLYISWDNYTDGHNYSNNCDCQSGDDDLDDSHRLVLCDEVASFVPGDIDCACEARYSVGDRVMLLVDNPDGATDLPAGTRGTVLCGQTGSYDLYVSWDSWSEGHNNSAFCDCQSGDDDLDDSHYFVLCDDVVIDDGIIHVPGDFETIRGAINASVDGDTIQIAAGTYYENDLRTFGRAVTISGAIGSEGEPTTIVDGQSVNTVFIFTNGETNSTRLENIVIQNGSYAGEGGGMYIKNAQPWIMNCTFLYNTAEEGAGVYLEDSYNVKFEGCRFLYNQADYSGGGLYAGSNTYMQIWDSTFDGNNAQGGGGALLSSTGYQAVIHDTEFVANSAQYGGGLYAYYVYVNMDGNVFRDNIAEDQGGGVRLYECNGSIQDCTLLDNSANHGGGVYVNSDYGTSIIGTHFEGNGATSSGGGLYSGYDYDPLYMYECTFVDNMAENGAGIYGIYTDLEIYWSSFTGGYASNDGGAVYAEECALEAGSCSFTSNRADEDGGALSLLSASGESSFTSCDFSGNQADAGGGVFAASVSSGLSISDCDFNGNTATTRAGAFYGFWCDPAGFTGCSFRGNSAISSDFTDCRGGAIYIIGMDPTLTECTIEDNTSGTGGGIYNFQGYPILDGCTVSSNVGKICGGGMFSDDGVAWLTGTTFCANQPDNIIGGWVDQGDNVLSPDCDPGEPLACVADTNADYNVDVLDLLYVIAVWNTDNAAGDINEDGWVDVLDLLQVLSNWGQCNEA